MVKLLAVILPTLALLSQAHTVIKHPAPRHDKDDQLKQFPCGQNGQYNQFGSTVPLTTLTPGPNEIRFQETISHNGAPFRIAFTWGNDDKYDQYVLADHIPHAQGGKSGDYYVATVNIPDVDCSADAHCAIQIQQIMSDKFALVRLESCPNPLDAKMCGFSGGAYFTCANVAISGKQDVTTLEPFYSGPDGVRANSIPAVRDAYKKGENAVYTKNANGDWVVPTKFTAMHMAVDSEVVAAPVSPAVAGAVVAGGLVALVVIIALVVVIRRRRAAPRNEPAYATLI
jgi:hypothetical protein